MRLFVGLAVAMAVGCDGPVRPDAAAGGMAGTHALHLRVTGPGEIRVSNPASSCNGDCVFQLEHGSTIRLDPVSAVDSMFMRWSGACDGTAGCDLIMDAEHEASASFSSRPRYSILELPAIDGIADIRPRGINSRNDVVGQYPETPSAPTAVRAFLYDAELKTTRRLTDEYGVAFGINDRRQVAMTTQGSHTNGSRWDAGPMTDIGALSGAGTAFSYASGINAAGWIVGWAASSSGAEHAVLWDGSLLHDLSPRAASAAGATAINSAGIAVGFVYAADQVAHAALFIDGHARDLGTLGGETWALGINDCGRIVGFSDTSTGERGIVYDLPNGPMQEITPGRPSTLWSVNAAGDAVGALLDITPVRAVLWHQGNVIDLTDALGDATWVLLMASGINESGAIVGWGRLNGQNRGFLLVPRSDQTR